ncbi:hypothetical protein OXX79_012573, partial [Metschnikowia pulcherrima]
AQDGGNLIQECAILTKGRREYFDYELQDDVAAKTQQEIDKLEKSSAIERKKQEKASGLDKQKQKEAEQKKADLREKPATDDDLTYKLNMMRKSMGLPMGSDAGSLFTPDDMADATGASKNSRKGKKQKARKR